MILARQRGQVHFTKSFGEGTESDRVLLPGKDGCRVKVTIFRPKANFKATGIRYPYDETFYVIRGAMTATVNGEVIPLSTGATFHVPAGDVYDLEVDVDSVVHCTFSAGPNGELPDDD